MRDSRSSPPSSKNRNDERNVHAAISRVSSMPMSPVAAATPLGQLLIDRGLIATEDLDRALELQRERRGEKLGKILVDMGFVAQRDLLAALSEQMGLPIAQLGAPAAAPELEGMSTS